MNRYIYLSLTPEALIASMLPPQEFGTYMAVGSQKKSRGQVMFFEVDQAMVKDILPQDYIEKRCVPSATGTPKRSVYLSIYRALESIPTKALKGLYLATTDGRILELNKAAYTSPAGHDTRMHLYQEIGPVFSCIASSLDPEKFLQLMTDKKQYALVPKLIFAEMHLDNLATDPEKGTVENLPYPNIDHLRDCLSQLKQDPSKQKKTFLRSVSNTVLYRTLTNGFFVGSQDDCVFYPYPSQEELNDKYHAWWRSANSVLL